MLSGIPAKPLTGSLALYSVKGSFPVLTWMGFLPVCRLERLGEQNLYA